MDGQTEGGSLLSLTSDGRDKRSRPYLQSMLRSGRVRRSEGTRERGSEGAKGAKERRSEGAKGAKGARHRSQRSPPVSVSPPQWRNKDSEHRQQSIRPRRNKEAAKEEAEGHRNIYVSRKNPSKISNCGPQLLESQHPHSFSLS